MHNIIIFASGSGTNARNIIQYFSNSPLAKVAAIFCNKPGAGVVDIAREYQLPCIIIERGRFFNGDAYLPEIQSFKPSLLVLAGFLWKVPATLINHFPDAIINIHPALLPKYGGKGLYGSYVHEAVINAGEKESGITIHYVDEIYDNGTIIYQHTCPVHPHDSPASLAEKIHALEYAHYPVIIAELLSQQKAK